MTRTYVLTQSAAEDLRGIVRYTLKQWGEAQARIYTSKLRDAIDELATGKGLLKDLSAVHPGLRARLCEHHYIFCLPRDDAPALVIAILHERMDLLQRLKGRLTL